MQLTAILATALTAAATVSAGPVKRVTCQIQYPQAIGFPINYNVSKTINPPTERVDAVTFQVPPNAPGPCSLVASFPAGFPIQQSGASQVNFFATTGSAAGRIVGTITFESDSDEPVFRTINSFACEPVMGYEMRIASDSEDGFVAFSEVQGAGLQMLYGC